MVSTPPARWASWAAVMACGLPSSPAHRDQVISGRDDAAACQVSQQESRVRVIPIASAPALKDLQVVRVQARALRPLRGLSSGVYLVVIKGWPG
jgi:hypothetical protein